MHILALMDYYPPHFKGGHEISMRLNLDALQKRGHQATVFTSWYGLPGPVVDSNIHRVFKTVLESEFDGLLKKPLALWAQLQMRQYNQSVMAEALSRIQPDIVYCGQLHGISIGPLLALQAKGIPVAHRLGNYFFVELMQDCVLKINPLKKWIRSVVHGFHGLDTVDATHFTVVSEAVKKTYVSAGFPGENISVIPFRGIPAEDISNAPKNYSAEHDTGPRLVYAGRLAQNKGVHLLIPMMRELIEEKNYPGVSLDIYGGGDTVYIESLERQIFQNNLANTVHLKGKVPARELLKSLGAYDVLLAPSIWEEPSGGIILEAMSQGLPAVGACVGGIPEFIQHGKTGYVVPPENVNALADAVVKIWENPDTYRSMSRMALQIVREQFTLEKVVDQVEKYLINITREKE